MWRAIVLGALVACVGAACGDDSGNGNNNNENGNGNGNGVCGDGHLDANEECDDGANNSDVVPDACRSNCRRARCGDGQVDTGEDCDGVDLDDEDCVSLGLDGGSLSCDASCVWDLTGCSGCGNTVKEADEECDTEDVGDQTCATETTYQEGTLTCSNQCLLDTSGCHTCGNDTVEGPEQCDGSIPANVTCDTEVGHTEGTLSCDENCRIDTSDCSTCGNATIEGSEVCDGSQVTGSCGAITSGNLPDGILGCLSDCSGPDTSHCNDCGNGTIEGDEVCDGNNVGTATCSSITGGTLTQGTPTCASDCYSMLSTTCGECGNGVCELDAGETTTSCVQDCGWTAVAAGQSTTCGVKADGTLWCWGTTEWDGIPLDPAGADSHGDYVTPTQVPGLTDVTALAMRYNSGCVIAGGLVYCWGMMSIDWTPTQVGSFTDPTSLTVGDHFGCVVDGGDAYCWGAGSAGQLGNGTFLDSAGPVAVTKLETTSTYLKLVAGGAHVCAVENYHSSFPMSVYHRRVLCWGENGSGQVGVNYPTDQATPQSTGLGGVLGIGSYPLIELWMGASHTIANRTDDFWASTTVYLKVWGQNGTGQLGTGNQTEYHVPTDLTSVTTYTTGQGGLSHTCAVSAVWHLARCFGSNAHHQLGMDCTDSTPENQLSAVDVANADEAAAVATGTFHSCSLTTSGDLQCWGDSGHGETGTSVNTVTTVCPATMVLDPYDP